MKDWIKSTIKQMEIQIYNKHLYVCYVKMNIFIQI